MKEGSVELVGREEKIQRIKNKFSEIDWAIVPENKLRELYAVIFRLYLVS